MQEKKVIKSLVKFLGIDMDLGLAQQNFFKELDLNDVLPTNLVDLLGVHQQANIEGPFRIGRQLAFRVGQGFDIPGLGLSFHTNYDSIVPLSFS